MPGFDQTAVNKQYPQQRWAEWKETVSRKDIYRQRVFGNKSGANNFIAIDDKRKLTLTHLLIYAIFFVIAAKFQWDIVQTGRLQPVISAIDQGLNSAMFTTEPTPRTFRDITSLDDVRAWITNAFPLFVASGKGGYGVQGVNLPLNPIRFTVRRMKAKEVDSENRFYDMAPVVWEDYLGISPEESSSLDDEEDYGYSRQWVSLSQVNPLEPVRFPGLYWHKQEDFQCSTDGELTQLDTLEFQNKNKSEAEELCKGWCESQQLPQPCVCWTLSGQYTCTFYAVNEGNASYLVNAEEYEPYNVEACNQQGQPNTCPNAWSGINGKTPCGYNLNCNGWPSCLSGCDCSSSFDCTDPVPVFSVAPNCATLEPMCEVQLGRTAYWMSLKTFVYSNDQTGFNKRNGYVQNISEWPSQEDLLNAPNEGVPLESTQAIANQVGDWIAGNYLSLFTSTLTIDFVVFNPNFDVFVWVRLFFICMPSGSVEVSTSNYPLYIEQPPDEQESKVMTKVLEVTGESGVVYVILLMCYILSELYYIFFGKGFAYIFSVPNIISMFQLVCQAATVFFFFRYADKKIRTPLLEADGKIDLNAIKGLVADFDWVLTWSGMAMAGMAINWLRYLNDCLPRVHVLIDTIFRSCSPIFYWFIIVLMLMLGFMMWGHLMFGASVVHFARFPTTFRIMLFWLFGENRSLQDLSDVYPVAGSLCYFIPFMVIFGFILFKFPTAVILVSYEDADERHKDKKDADKERRRAEEASSGNDQLILDQINKLKARLRKWMPRKTEQMEAEESSPKSIQRKAMMSCVFVVYIICYVCMTYMMIYVGDSFRVQETIRSAVETPTFSQVLPVTGFVTQRNFSQINSREDVMLWIEEALPKVMFNSSSDNTLFGSENPLKVRAPGTPEHPEDWRQLVIANWNIVIGQQPVRISNRYVKLHKPAAKTWGSLFWNGGYLPYWGTDGRPVEINDFGIIVDDTKKTAEVLAASIVDIEDPQAKQVLAGERCRGHDESPSEVNSNLGEPIEPGWFCMLSVDAHETQEILNDLVYGHMINNQSLLTIIDFAVYNGYSQTFGYAEIIFRFHPSGAVHKSVYTQSFRMELYWADASNWGVVRLFLEIIVSALTLAYIVKFIWDLYKYVEDDNAKLLEESGTVDIKQKFIGVIRSMAFFMISDVFNTLDFLSLALTVTSLLLWYLFAFSELRRNYFFQDTPVWQYGQYPCGIDGEALWCSDEEVLVKFKDTAQYNRLFIQITGISIIFLFFRLLRVLMALPRVRMMWKSIESGLGDITLLVLLMLLVIGGFLLMGRQWYGVQLEGYSTAEQCMRLLVSILFGHIDYDDMREAQSSFHTVIFLYSYLAVVKILFLNGFLAILDRHFRAQVEDIEKRDQNATEKPWTAAFVDYLRRTFGRSKQASDGEVDGGEDPQEQRNSVVVGPGSPVAGVHPSTPTNAEVPKQRKGADDKKKLREEKRNNLLALLSNNSALEESLSDTNWRFLPNDMKTWSRETCLKVTQELQQLMEESEDKSMEDEANLEPTTRARRLKDVESAIKVKVKHQEERATTLFKSLMHRELRALKHVHVDQESLAWYIAKKEKDLASLQAARDAKEQDRKAIEQAAKALVRSDDSDEDERPAGFGGGVGPSAGSNGYPAIGNEAASPALNALGNGDGVLAIQP